MLRHQLVLGKAQALFGLADEAVFHSIAAKNIARKN